LRAGPWIDGERSSDRYDADSEGLEFGDEIAFVTPSLERWNWDVVIERGTATTNARFESGRTDTLEQAKAACDVVLVRLGWLDAVDAVKLAR
jgi:hypothetical protein